MIFKCVSILCFVFQIFHFSYVPRFFFAFGNFVETVYNISNFNKYMLACLFSTFVFKPLNNNCLPGNYKCPFSVESLVSFLYVLSVCQTKTLCYDHIRTKIRLMHIIKQIIIECKLYKTIILLLCNIRKKVFFLTNFIVFFLTKLFISYLQSIEQK